MKVYPHEYTEIFQITIQFFNNAVVKNINIRFILIISVLVVPIYSLFVSIFFLFFLFFLLVSLRRVFSVWPLVIFVIGMLKTCAGKILSCVQSNRKPFSCYRFTLYLLKIYIFLNISDLRNLVKFMDSMFPW